MKACWDGFILAPISPICWQQGYGSGRWLLYAYSYFAPPTEWLWTIFTFRTEPWTASPGSAQSWSASSSSLVWSTAGYWWGRPGWDRFSQVSRSEEHTSELQSLMSISFAL